MEEGKRRPWSSGRSWRVDSQEGAELEFETALSAFFSHGAKKRYVGRVVWPREEMLIRGYEVRRTDSFDLLSETMTEMFEMLLDGNTEGAVDMTKLAIDEVRGGMSTHLD